MKRLRDCFFGGLLVLALTSVNVKGDALVEKAERNKY